MRRSLLPLFVLVVTSLVSPAQAQWCGHCGNVYLSFAPDSLVSTRTVDVTGGSALIDLYALLGDVPPIRWQGERVLYVGGFELRLDVAGDADVEVLNKKIPGQCVDIGQGPTACVAGLSPGFSLENGPVQLVHWRIMVPQGAHDVTFRLAAEGAPSCERTPGCRGTGTRVIWAGSYELGQEGLLFGAGCVAAYLNRTADGEPDLTPVRGRTDWQELGIVTIAPADTAGD